MLSEFLNSGDESADSGTQSQFHEGNIYNMSQKTFRPIFLAISFCLVCLFAAMSAVPAQDKPSGVGGAQPDAKKAFEKLKALSGSWQGTIMGISINFTIRTASSGTTILHEATTPGGGPPNHEITMFYLEGDRLLATHYCDAGNRSHMEGKLTADGNGVEFSLLELVGSKKGGFLNRLMFTATDADRHVVELDFVQPNGKPIPLRGEFQRTNSSQHLSNKRLYDGGTMMLLLSASDTLMSRAKTFTRRHPARPFPPVPYPRPAPGRPISRCGGVGIWKDHVRQAQGNPRQPGQAGDYRVRDTQPAFTLPAFLAERLERQNGDRGGPGPGVVD
jgi:hypothetical protein